MAGGLQFAARHHVLHFQRIAGIVKLQGSAQSSEQYEFILVCSCDLETFSVAILRMH